MNDKITFIKSSCIKQSELHKFYSVRISDINKIKKDQKEHKRKKNILREALKSVQKDFINIDTVCDLAEVHYFTLLKKEVREALEETEG